MSRRVVVLSIATLFVGYSVGVWNTWTAGLATNGWFVAAISVPGLISAFIIAKDAVGPADARAGHRWFVARALSSDPLEIDLESPVVLALGSITILATTGVAVGMMFGGMADNWRVDLYLSGVGHPGRVVVVLGVLLFLIMATMFFALEVEWAGWGLAAGAILIVVGFAVGVRTLTGAFPEAERIADQLSVSGTADSSGVGSVAEAIARSRSAEAEFVDAVPGGHVVGVAMAELLDAPDEWKGSVVTFEGMIGTDRTTFGRNRAGDSIEAWMVADESGRFAQVLVWRQRGQTVPDTDSPCAGVITVTGQILSVPSDDTGVLAVVAHDWSCAERRSPATENLRGGGDVAVLRRFDRELTDDRLLTVGQAYRAIPGFDGYIVLVSSAGWRDGIDGSAVLGIANAGHQPQDLCNRLLVADGGNEQCYVTEFAFAGEGRVVLR